MKNPSIFSNFSIPASPALPRTDLACETVESGSDTAGAVFGEYESGSFRVCELFVEKGEGEKSTGKKSGTYLTIHCPPVLSLCDAERLDLTDLICKKITDLTQRVTGSPVDSSLRILVAGLGNRFISADSIGPRTADKIAVTSHMRASPYESLFERIGCASLSAVHPGVMGQTGIEAAAMIKGACDYVKPHAVIAVDALAARSVSRLGCTFQLCDTGIEPGSGIGNRRCRIDRETLGYPVIAIGVPTVVDCATLIFDALSRTDLSEKEMESLYPSLEKERDLFVSPRDCDVVAEELSSILANAVNQAFFCEGL